MGPWCNGSMPVSKTVDGGSNPSGPARKHNIYVNAETIDRRTAEEAVAWYLRKKGVLKSEPRFRWNKLKDRFYIQPVSLMGD